MQRFSRCLTEGGPEPNPNTELSTLGKQVHESEYYLPAKKDRRRNSFEKTEFIRMKFINVVVFQTVSREPKEKQKWMDYLEIISSRPRDMSGVFCFV